MSYTVIRNTIKLAGVSKILFILLVLSAALISSCHHEGNKENGPANKHPHETDTLDTDPHNNGNGTDTTGSGQINTGSQESKG